MRLNRLFVVAALALAAVAYAVTTAATDTYARAVAAVHRAWGFVRDRFRIAPDSPPDARRDLSPVVLLVAAKAFMGRLAKRERPNVSPTWRMCPSI